MFHAVNALFVIFLLAGVPILSYLTARQDEILRVSRKTLYFSAAVSQWVLAILAALAAILAQTGVAGLVSLPWMDFVRWTAGITGAALAATGLGLVLESLGWWPGESPLVNRLIPITRSEKLWALGVVAPTAGFCEEFIYRGYLLNQIVQRSHSLPFAWALSSIAFGLCHAYQKFGGVVRATLLGGLLAAPLVFAGSIYPAMAAHFLIDVAAFVWIGPHLLEARGADLA